LNDARHQGGVHEGRASAAPGARCPAGPERSCSAAPR
jgi:hypothetical protein